MRFGLKTTPDLESNRCHRYSSMRDAAPGGYVRMRRRWRSSLVAAGLTRKAGLDGVIDLLRRVGAADLVSSLFPIPETCAIHLLCLAANCQLSQLLVRSEARSHTSTFAALCSFARSQTRFSYNLSATHDRRLSSALATSVF